MKEKDTQELPFNTCYKSLAPQIPRDVYIYIYIHLNQNRLVSFDVEALFPSFPVEKLMKYLEKWLNDIGLQKEEAELTKMCVEQNHFSFTNKFYKQDSGLSMGNPLSPFLANLFVSFLETELIKAFPYIFKIWHRYVDNIFTIIPSRHIHDALKLLNIQDNFFKFTLETEIDSQLPFLDFKITTKSNRLTFGIYRKKKTTYRMLHKVKWLQPQITTACSF